jgi:hypothetical protein
MFRGKWGEIENIVNQHTKPVSIVGKVKKDTYNGGYFIDWADIS